MPKIYMDDVRETPHGYLRTYNVGTTIWDILCCEKEIGLAWGRYIQGSRSREDLDRYIETYTITEISCDNDLGPGEPEGYKLLDWLEATGRNYPIRIHTDNAVARERMLAICERNGWEIVK